MLVTYAVPETWVVVEEIMDQTKKVNAGVKDMFITSISEMTRRSRAIKLIAYGNDSSNTFSLMQNAERKLQVNPDFAVRGSITQLDENIAKKQTEGGFSLPFFSASKAGTTSSAMLGIDLSVISAKDFTIVPGVTSKNSTLLYKEGSGSDGEGTIKKLGLNFSYSLSKSDGQAQALRNLVELAAIELVGRLNKLPYWQCLGIDGKTDEVKLEVSDWWEELNADKTRLITYLQRQLKARGVYTGDIDGEADDELLNGLLSYRRAMGIQASSKVDEEFFSTYLASSHMEIQGKARTDFAKYLASKPAPMAPAALSPDGVANVKLNLLGDSPKRDQNYSISIATDRDAFVYCYLQDENDKIARVFPNRFVNNALIKSGGALQLPGQQPFGLVANSKGVLETFACFASATDVAGNLPSAAWGVDLEPLNVSGFDAIGEAFAKTSQGKIGLGVLDVKVK
jgi:curli biogenesis system outer membrane secretion channel CsgG